MEENIELKGLFLLDEAYKWEIIEQAFNLPLEQRTAFIIQKMKEQKCKFLGNTDKSAPELAIEMNKKGIKARSYVKGNEKKCPPTTPS